LGNKIENGVLGKKGTIDAYFVVEWGKMNIDDRLGMAGVWNLFSMPLSWQVLVGSGMISLTTKSPFGHITRLGFYSLGKGEFSIFHMGNNGVWILLLCVYGIYGESMHTLGGFDAFFLYLIWVGF